MEIKLRCHVTSPAIWNRGTMFTEDISRNGLRFAWRAESIRMPRPVAGQLITVEVELPAHHAFDPKCIHCQGVIVRVSGVEGNQASIAVRVNYMDFRSFNDRIRSFESLNPVMSCWA